MATLTFDPKWTLTWTLIIFLLQVQGNIAGPTRRGGTPSRCDLQQTQCRESVKFGFRVGHTYSYDYKTEISSSVLSDSPQHQRTRLLFTSRARISAISPCEFLLNLDKVTIQEASPDDPESFHTVDGGRDAVEALERFPLRFSLQEGRIDHLCAAEDDPTWVVNAKRGVLSTIQYSGEETETSVKETDVNGRCLTTYSMEGEGSIKRTKDLTSCAQRHSLVTALQSIPYSSTSARQPVHLIKGIQTCRQMIKHSIMEQVHCEEILRFKPFDNNDSGAQTKVTQTLVYSSSEHRMVHNSEDLSWRRTTLLFERGYSSLASSDVISTLNKLEKDSVPEVKATAPHLFVQLVEGLQLLDLEALKSLFTTESKSPTSRKHLMDAIPLVKTGPSVALMKNLISEDAISSSQVDTWLTSLIFIKHPTLDMISVLQPLLQGETPNEQALFGISSLIYSYCRNHQNCGSHPPIETSLRLLVKQMGPMCQNDDAKKQMLIVSAIKALGNAGRLPSDSQNGYNSLVRCMKEKTNPIEVRLAAIDAFRRIPCDDVNRSPILDLYRNMKEDTEVRIGAYLGSMRCASRKILDSVVDVLNKDSVNQVGSFVWTHLTNLQESSSPEKQAIRAILSSNVLQNKFNADARKFSRNFEGSYFNEEVNLGLGYDSNLVFNQESFLPKSAMVNLTAHLFGESVNLFELGVRFQSLEQLLEPLFGPSGYFPDESITEALRSARSKRDLRNNEIERLGDLFKQAKQSNEQLPGGSLYARVFGHELLYKSFHVSDQTSAPTLYDENGKNWLDLTRLLDNIGRGKAAEFTESKQILDASYNIPTSAGIPLSLGVQATLVYGINARGKFDLSKFWDMKEIEIQGLLRPSTSLQVDGVMTVQFGGGNIRSGIRVNNNLHSSTAVQGRVVLKGKRLIHTELTLPQDKQEIFGAKSEVIIVNPSGESLGGDNEQTNSQICSPESLSTAFGIKMCGKIQLPSAFNKFPFPSSSALSVYLEKTDVFNSYQIDWRNGVNPTDVSFVFNTPGSQINRRLAFNYIYDSTQGKFDVNVEGFEKILSAEGRYQPTMKSIKIMLKDGQEKLIFLTSALRIQGKRIEPNFLLTYRDKEVVALHGKLDLIQDDEEGKQKANFDLTLQHLTVQPIRLSGELSSFGETHHLDAGVESSKVSGNVRSIIRITRDHFSTKSQLSYSWDGKDLEKVDLSTKVQKTRTGDLKRYNAMVNFNSQKTSLDFFWEIMSSKGYCENTVKLGLNKIEWTGHSLFRNQKKVRNEGGSHNELQISLSCPKRGINYRMEFEHQLSNSSILTRFLVKTDEENEIRAMLTALSKPEPNGLAKKSVRAGLNWPGFEYSLKGYLNEVKAREFESEVVVHRNGDEEMKVTLNYKNLSANEKLDYSLDLWAKGFFSHPIQAGGALSADDSSSHLNAQLEIEGDGEWSGRWGTSLDYNVIRRRVHKLEGKLTLNDHKYSGEMTYRLNRAGYNALLVDLQLNNHILVDAKWKAVWPTQMSGTFSLYPDLDGDKDYKFELQAGISQSEIEKSGSLKVDYFGEMVSVEGAVGIGKFSAGATWGDDKNFAIAIDAPEISLKRTILTLTVKSSFIGFEDGALIIRHRMDDSEIECQIKGMFNAREAIITLSGVHSYSETKISASVDAKGYSLIEGDFLLRRSNDHKMLEFVVKRGDLEKRLKLEHLDNARIKTAFYFSGWKYIPEISAELKREDDREEIFRMLEINWAREEKKQLTLKLRTKKDKALNYQIEWKSPWASIAHMTGKMSHTSRNGLKEIEIALNGDLLIFPILPLQLKGRIEGDWKDFKGYSQISWIGNENEGFKMSTEGKWLGWWESRAVIKLEVAKRLYEIGLESDINRIARSKLNKVEVSTNFNGISNSGGVKWSVRRDWKELQGTIWAELADLPKASIKFAHDISEDWGTLKGKLNVVKDDKILANIKGDIEAGSWSMWSLKALVESDLVQGTIASSTREDLEHSRFHHSSTVTGFGMEERLDFKVDLKRDGGFTLIGQVGEDEVKISGKYNGSGETKSFRWKLSNPFTPSIEGTGSYRRGNNDLSIYFQAIVADQEILYLNLAGGHHKGTNSEGNIEFKCPFGHHVIGNFSWIANKRSIYINLIEDEANLISFTLSGKIGEDKGETLFSFKCPYISYFEDGIKLQGDYKFSGESFNQQLSYISGAQEYKLISVANWNLAIINFQTKFKGSKSCSIALSLEDLSTFKGDLVWMDEKIGEITALYQITEEGEEFPPGISKVSINLATSPENSLKYVIAFTSDDVGYKSWVKTPHRGWEDIGVEWAYDWNGDEIMAKISLKKAREHYELMAKGLKEDNLKKLSLLIITPFTKLSEFKANVQYGLTKNHRSYEILGFFETKDIQMRISFLPASSLKIDLKSNYELARNVKIDFIWDILRGKKRSVKASCNWNDLIYEIKGEMELSSRRGLLDLDLVGFGDRDYVLKLDFDNEENRRSREHRKLEGKFARNLTSIRGFWGKETKNKHFGSLEWRIDQTTNTIEYDLIMEDGKIKIEVKTPFAEWEKLESKLNYAFREEERKIHLKFNRINQSPIEFHAETKLVGDFELHRNVEGLLLLETQLPLKSLEDLKIKIEYIKKGNNHLINGTLINSGDLIDCSILVDVEKGVENFKMFFEGKLDAPTFGIKESRIKSNGIIHMKGESQVSLELEHNGKKRNLQTRLQISDQKLQITGESSFPFMKTFEVSGELSQKGPGKGDGMILCRWNDIIAHINGDIIEFESLANFKGRLEGSLPIEGLQSLQAEMEIKIKEGKSKMIVSFQNHRYRYMGKFEGVYLKEGSKFHINIYTPSKIVNSLSLGGSYSLDPENRNLGFSYEQNGIELIKTDFQLTKDKIHMHIQSQLSTVPLNCKVYGEWADIFTFKMNGDIKIWHHHLRLNTNVGSWKHGELEFNYPHKWLRFQTNWKVHVDSKDGHVKFGGIWGENGVHKSLESSWRKEGWVSMKADLNLIGFSQNEKNIAIQYSLTPQNSGQKLGGSIVYNLFGESDHVTIITSIRNTHKIKSLELSIATPYQIIKEGSLSLRLNQKPEFSLEFTASRNGDLVITVHSGFALHQLASRFKLDFDCPFLGERFNVNAMYDLEASTDKSLDLAFNQGAYSFKFRCNAGISDGPKQEVELKVNIESNIPRLPVSASGSIRASYSVDTEGSKQVSVSVESPQTGDWHITAKARVSPIFKVNLKFESPLDDILPDMHFDLTWAEHRGRLNLKAGNFPEIKSLIELSGFPSDGRMKRSTDKTILLEFTIGDARLNIRGDIQNDKFSLKLNSSLESIRDSSLDMKFTPDGRINVTGIWGERLLSLNGFIKSGGESFWKHGESDLELSTNYDQNLKIKSKHLFGNNQYSFNVSVGELFSLNSYLQRRLENILNIQIKWGNDDKNMIKFIGECSRGKFKTFLDTPWLENIEMDGHYKLMDTLYSGSSSLTYNKIKSIIRAEARFSSNNIEADITVILPPFNQSMDGRIKLSKEENFEGEIEMRLSDRKFSIKGILSRAKFHGIQNGGKKLMQERKLTVSIKIPSSQFHEVKGEFIIKHPNENSDYSSGYAEGSLSIPSGTTKILLNYDYSAHQKVTGELRIESYLIESLEVHINFAKNLKTLEGSFHHSESELRVNWDFTTPEHIYEFTAYLPFLSNPKFVSWKVEGGGVWDGERKLEAKIKLTAFEKEFNVELSSQRHQDSLINLVTLRAPTLFQDKLELNTKFSWPAISHYQFNLEASYGKISLDLTSHFLKRHNHLSISVEVKGDLGSHQCVLDLNYGGDAKEIGVKLNLDSPLLGQSKNVEIIGKIDRKNGGIDMNLDLVTIKSRYSAQIHFLLDSQGEIQMKIELPQMASPLSYDMKWSYEGQSLFIAKIDMEAFGKSHNAELEINIQAPEFRLEINCLYLSSNPLRLHGKGILVRNHLELLLDAHVFGSRWRSEGILKFATFKNIGLKLEIITPFEIIDRITLDGQLGPNEFSFEIFTPFKDLPNVKFLLAGVPILSFKDWYENWRGSEVIIGLPSAQYNLKITSNFPAHLNGHIGEYTVKYEEFGKNVSGSNKYEATLSMSSYDRINLNMDKPAILKFTTTTPLYQLRNLQLEIGGQMNWPNFIGLKTIVNCNERVGQVHLNYGNTRGKTFLSIKAKTPFENYSDLTFSSTIHNPPSGLKLNMDLESLIWKEQFKGNLLFYYQFNGLFDFNGECNMIAYNTEIPEISFKIQSLYKGSVYKGLIANEWGNQKQNLSIDLGMLEDQLFADVALRTGITSWGKLIDGSIVIRLTKKEDDISTNIIVKMPGEKILFGLQSVFLNSPETFQASVKITTVFEALSSFETMIKISPLTPEFTEKFFTDLDINLSANYNLRELFKIELANKDGRRRLTIQNPIAPIAIIFHLVRESELKDIHAEFCWDLEHPLESTIGAKLSLIRSSAKEYTLLKLQSVPLGWIEISFDRQNTLTNLNHLAKMRWESVEGNGVGELGYYIYFDNESTLKNVKYSLIGGIDMPWRTLEIESHITANDRETSRCLELKWDKKRDPNKRIGVRLTQMKKTGWQTIIVKDTITFVYSAMKNNLSLISERNYKNGELIGIQLAFDPTGSRFDRLIFTLNQDGTKGIEMQIKHDASNFLLNIMSQELNQRQKELVIRYKCYNGEKYILRVERGPSNPMFLITAGLETNPQKILRIDQSTPKPTAQLFKIQTDHISLIVQIVKDLPYAEIILSEDVNERKWHFTVGFPDKKEIGIKIKREITGQKFNDLDILFGVNSSHIVSKAKWRPELAQDLQSITLDFKPTLTRLKNAISTGLREIDSEINNRWKFIRPGLRDMVENIALYTIVELEEIVLQIIRLGKLVENHYHMNTLFIKDICDVFTSGIEFMKQIWMKLSVHENSQIFLEKSKDVKDWLEIIWVENSGKLENIFDSTWKEAENGLRSFWNENFSWIGQNYDLIYEYLDTMVDLINGKIDYFQEKLKSNGLFKKLKDIFYDYANLMSEFPVQVYVDRTREYFTKRVREPIEMRFKPQLDALSKSIEEGNIKSILEVPPFPYIRHTFKNIKGVFARMSKLVDAEKRIKDLIKQSLQNMDNLIMRNIPLSSIIWRPKEGHVEYNQALGSLEWEDLTQAPLWRKTREDEKNLEEMNTLYYQIMHGIQNAKPLFDFNLREILPPYGATAIMAGNHHYYTFDRKYFQFAGECSYVLVADLLYNNFSLIVNYESVGNLQNEVRKKSYTITSDQNNVEIDVTTFQVTLNSRKIDLPLEVGSIVVRRQPSGLELFDTRGFSLICSQSGVCAVSTSGWYFGKLGGLLGTYDNEEINDLQTPEGIIEENVGQFAHAWRVGNRAENCKPKNYAISEMASSLENDEMCSRYFIDKESPLRPCFEQVPSDVFKAMCSHDTSLKQNSATKLEAACTSIGAYVATCQRHGVDIWMPPSCVRCNMDNGDVLYSGDVINLESGDNSTRASTDVVFLIEESSCLKGVSFDNIITKLDIALRAKGLTDNAYAIVGYGGGGINRKPHLRTISGSVWSHNTIFRVPIDLPMNGDGNGNLYEAVEFGVELGFRAGVSKLFVAFACGNDKCGSDGNYGDTLTLLLENDIKLHLLMGKSFEMKRFKKEDELDRVFGIDLMGAYIGAHAKGSNGLIYGDPGVRKHVILPKDMCTPLAMESNGTSFSLKEAESRKFLDVWSTRVAQTAQPSECQRCECVPDKMGGANLLCHQCISPNIRLFLEDWEKYQDEEVITGNIDELEEQQKWFEIGST